MLCSTGARPSLSHEYSDHDDDVVPALADVLDVESQLRPGPSRLLEVLPYPLMAAVSGGFHLTAGHAKELALGIPQGKETGLVVRVERLEPLQHHLHALPRHRPPSIRL